MGVRLKRVWARFVLVLSLDTDKMCCRWGRSSLKMVMLAARCCQEMNAVGSIEILQDLLGSHDQPQLKKDGYSWTRQGRRVYSMFSAFSSRSFQG